MAAEECEARGGEAVGLQCHFKPDVYMLSVLLTFGTFALAWGLNNFRHSRFFGSTFRNALSDFGVVIAIVVMTMFSLTVGLDVPSLHVPQQFRPTLDRPWIVDISSVPLVVAFIACLPAAFYTILIVMDQQITAVIINRKDNMLRKGEGYHLDLLCIAVLVLICSFLGLPFYVAATVLSVMHVNSLRVYSESSAPGEIPRFLGVNEQRLTAIFAHSLIGLSVFLTRVIKGKLPSSTAKTIQGKVGTNYEIYVHISET
uniref:Bicarbonate transporter domain containing protein n=1 Tax=Haemonchus contortus TaxID=6289 RepID=W6NM39_HAECO